MSSRTALYALNLVLRYMTRSPISRSLSALVYRRAQSTLDPFLSLLVHIFREVQTISLNGQELLNATCLLTYTAWLSLRIQIVSPQHSFAISQNYMVLLNRSYFQVVLHPSMIGPSKSQRRAPLTIKNVSMNSASYDTTPNPSTNPQLVRFQRTKYPNVCALISHFTNVLPTDRLSSVPLRLTEFISGRG